MPDTKKLLKRGFEFALKPLVDIPTLPGGAVGRAVEGALEGATSPVGMLSLALMPASLGTSFGLRGGAAVASRLGTRAATEFATASAGGMAAEEVSKRVQDQPGVIKYGAPLLAGFTGSAATLGGLNRAGLAATRMPPVDRLGTPSVQEAVPTTAITYPAVGKVPEQTLPVSTGKKNILDLLNRNAMSGDMPMSSLTPGIRAIGKTPSYMLDDLGMTVAKGEVYRNVLGEQNSATSVVTLFKDVMAKHPDDARETIIHELIHHKQQYLTPREIKNLSAQWKTQVKPAYDRFEGKVDKLVSRHNLDVPTTDTIEDKIDAIKKFIVDKDNTPEGTKLANSWDVLEGETDYAVRGGPQEWLAVTGAQRALARIEGTYSPNSPIRGLLQQYRTFIGGVDPAAQYRALDAMDNPNVVRARNAPAKATASGGRKMAIRANPGEEAVTLYRGDRTPTGDLSIDKTNPISALGQGIYFSDKSDVADRYRKLTSRTDTPSTAVEDFYKRLAYDILRENKKMGGWESPQPTPREYGRALAEAKRRYSNITVEGKDGTITSMGQRTSVSMPKSVLKSTIASNAKIPEELWNKIALAVNKTAGKKVADLYDSDAPGEHTLRGAMSFGRHAAPTNSTPDLKLRISTAVRRVLSDGGYTGVNYPFEGSTAYVFWDEQAIQRLQKGLPLKPPSVRRMEADAPKPSRAEDMAAASARALGTRGIPRYGFGTQTNRLLGRPDRLPPEPNDPFRTIPDTLRLSDQGRASLEGTRGKWDFEDVRGFYNPLNSRLTTATNPRSTATNAHEFTHSAQSRNAIDLGRFIGVLQRPKVIKDVAAAANQRGFNYREGGVGYGDNLKALISDVETGKLRTTGSILERAMLGTYRSDYDPLHLYTAVSEAYGGRAYDMPAELRGFFPHLQQTESADDPNAEAPRAGWMQQLNAGARNKVRDFIDRKGLYPAGRPTSNMGEMSYDPRYFPLNDMMKARRYPYTAHYDFERAELAAPSLSGLTDIEGTRNLDRSRREYEWLAEARAAAKDAAEQEAPSRSDFYAYGTGGMPRYAYGTGTPAWQRKEGQNPKGGLNAVGRASAKAGGHNLKPPVKAGDNPRRASFLARMGGMPGPEREPDGEPTRLLLSLQAWGASSKSDAKSKARAISARNKSK